MLPEDAPKEFPDVSSKLAAPKKISAFEKERQAAEEKRRRAEAENAAALRDFEESFGGQDDENEDDFDGFPRFNAPPTGPRAGLGAPPGRYWERSGPPRGGPGSLGPPPPNLKRKRVLDEIREEREAKREQDALASDLSKNSILHAKDSYSFAQPDDPDNIASRPTVQLSGLPPSMTQEDIRLLLRDSLPVRSVRFQPGPEPPPVGPAPTAKRALTAIATLATDTPTTQIDAAVIALKDKYLGYGFHLSISRHLSSTSLLVAEASTASFAEPFGAQKVVKDQPGRSSMRHAPPPSSFAPPDRYDAPSRSNNSPAQATLAVQTPLDISTTRAIHTVVDRLLSEPDPHQALEVEAMLMALPEVATDERFAFLYDARSTAGVYYRYLLWNDDPSYDSILEPKRLQRGPERVIGDVAIDWMPPYEEVPFADLTTIRDAIDHINYESSGEESDDAKEPHSIPGMGPPAENKYLTPLQVAKFAWLLSRMPPIHSRLRKGDVAAITSFAIKHAAAGADDIVDMLVLNIDKPYTRSECAKFDKEELDQDEDDYYEPDEQLPTITDPPTSDLPQGEAREAEDPSAAKLVSLYLINDILHNSSTAGVRNAWKYRQLFENAFKKQKTFERLGQLDKELGWGRMRMDKWRRQIGVLFEIWEHGSVFAIDVFEALKKSFFEQPVDEAEEAEKTEEKKLDEKLMARFKRIDGTGSPAPSPIVLRPDAPTESNADIDGAPIDDDLDGAPMDQDLDGAPMDDLDGAPIEEDTQMADDQPPPAVDQQPKSAFSIQGTTFNSKLYSKQHQTAPPKPRRKQAEDMFADSDEG